MLYAQSVLRRLWNFIRDLSGENDYARYRDRARRERSPVMTPREFYLWRLRKKYSGIHRCC